MENEKPRLTTFAKVFIAVILLVAVVLVQFFLLPWLGLGADREMQIIGTGRGVVYDFDSNAAFHSNDSRNYYFATREGMRYISSNNDMLLWSEMFSFNYPIISASGNYVAIGELSGGRNIRVYDEHGEAFQVSLENTILGFSVNETGILSVVAQYEGGYGVYVFNQHRATAENPLFHWTTFNDLIQPTHARVSPDGRYVAIAVLDLNVNVRTFVEFRYMNQSDAWGTDLGHFATEEFTGQLVTAMNFMENNRLIVATTSQIVCFQLGPGHMVSRRLWEIELENAKTHIAFFDGKHFAFAVGERLHPATGEGDPIGTVRIFGTNGVETGRFELGRRVTHLRMGHNSVIVGGDRSFHAINFRGTPLWEHTSLFDTRDVLFLENTNTILVAGSNQAEVFERVRVREDRFDDDFFDFEYEVILP